MRASYVLTNEPIRVGAGLNTTFSLNLHILIMFLEGPFSPHDSTGAEDVSKKAWGTYVSNLGK